MSNNVRYGFDKEYMKTLTSFSGADMVAQIMMPGADKPSTIGQLHTISYSTHRDINPVRSLGRINPAGFVRGPRTIAGSLIFAVFDRALVREFNDALYKAYKNQINQLFTQNTFGFDPRIASLKIKPPERFLTDEMPPFDITISMANEYGNAASMRILGVVVLQEGQVMSIENMMTENTMQYIARDISLLEEAPPQKKGFF